MAEQLPESTKSHHPRARERRRQILEAAEHVFAREGYTGATTQQIARRVGISQPAIYRYFESKKALFLETLRFRQDPMLLRFGAILESPLPAIEKIHRVIHASADLFGEYPNMGQVRLQAIAAVSDPEISAAVLGTLQLMVGSHEALFAAAKREGDLRPEVDPTVAAACLTGLALLSYVADGVEFELEATPDGRRRFGVAFLESVSTRPLGDSAEDAGRRTGTKT